MDHLEQQIDSPTAKPERIAELVAGMGSASVQAPRNLSASLINRLQQVADHHNGQVPLHGRLFSQWMHHAYPLECPYPHAAGTSQPLTPDEWMDESGALEIQATRGERESHIKRGALAVEASE